MDGDGTTVAQRFEALREYREGGCRVTVSGVVDEQLDPVAFSAGLPRTVVFDLDGVERITSFGVREWIRALGALQADYYAFVRCRPRMIDQFNMVLGFAGRGEVVSLYAPYLCPECDHEFDVLIDLRKDEERLARGPEETLPCERCSAEAEFDDVADEFLSFCRGQGPPKVTRLAQLLIDGKPDTDERLRVRKEVDQNLTALWLTGALRGGRRVERLLDGLEGDVLLECSGLTTVNEKGIADLGEVLGQLGIHNVYFARVRASVLRMLGKRKGGVRPAVVSLLLTARCASCSDQTLVELADSDCPSRGMGRCINCGTEAQAVEDDAVMALARELVTESPPGVSVYLERHPFGQSPDARPQSAAAREGVPATRYRVLNKIGSGGMAEVFLARQLGVEGFERNVALKRVLPQHSEDAEFARMFIQEARVAAQVAHPNVVQILELGRDEQSLFIAMEYVDGWNLATILRTYAMQGRKTPIDVACRIIADACAGLHAAHVAKDSEGQPLDIVHRDVSPQNILVSQDGTVKLTDFGVAKASLHVVKTHSGHLKGKVAYMAPEMVEPTFGPVGPHSDIFSLGIVLYEVIACQRLFPGLASHQVIAAILQRPLPNIRDVRDDIPDGLGDVLAKVLSRRIDERHATAAELRKDLEDVLLAFGRPTTSAAVAGWVEDLDEPPRFHANSQLQARSLVISQDTGTPTEPSPLTSATQATVASPRTGTTTRLPRRVAGDDE